MRVCMTSRVRPDRMEEYKQRHAAVWPEMLHALREAGWRNYSLFLSSDGLLVAYLETADLAAAQAAMDRTAVNVRWQAAMSEFFLTDGAPDRGFTVLEEIFNLEDQIHEAGLTAGATREKTMTTEPGAAARPASADAEGARQ